PHHKPSHPGKARQRKACNDVKDNNLTVKRTRTIMLLHTVIVLAVLAAAFWGTLALWFQAPVPVILAIIWIALTIAAIIGLIRGTYLPLVVFAFAWVIMQAWWWLGVRPSNDRQWIPE